MSWQEKNNTLYRSFNFINFDDAIQFINNIALLATKHNHHPKIVNTYNKVDLFLTTHDKGNIITEKDINLAKSIDTLLNMNIEISPNEIVAKVFEKIKKELEFHNFKIVKTDTQRPWGGFFVLNENDAEKFVATYFTNIDFKSLKISEKLSPKILVVAPHKRLSWQYHHRRAEIWQLKAGTAKVVTSDTDVENELKTINIGDQIILKCEERHRLIGGDNWGIVAEVWQHTNAQNPSDEDDIVRLQDDFGR